MTARHTASQDNSAGNSATAVAVLRAKVTGIPIAIRRSGRWPRRNAVRRFSVEA
jgi:hypothetical protein